RAPARNRNQADSFERRQGLEFLREFYRREKPWTRAVGVRLRNRREPPAASSCHAVALQFLPGKFRRGCRDVWRAGDHGLCDTFGNFALLGPHPPLADAEWPHTTGLARWGPHRSESPIRSPLGPEV